MKAESILAIRNNFLVCELAMVQGMNPISVEALSAVATPHLVLGCRESLEKDESNRQFILYAVPMRSNGRTGKAEFFAYRRGKGVGEGRLLGNVSVGIGGHVDLADVVHSESVINLNSTIGIALTREIKEEVKFSGGECELDLFSAGLLLDDSNEVGRVHLGVVMGLLLPDHIDMDCAEPELDTLGFMTAEELLSGTYPLENWTRIVLEHFQSKVTSE